MSPNPIDNYRPDCLFLEITSECNLFCRQCSMWKLEDKKDRLILDDYLRIVNEFSSMAPTGGVILTGGEIFLRPDLVFPVLHRCNNLNLETAINTNGTLFSDNIVRELLKGDPTKIIFSLDSNDAKIHDYIRGAKGTFDKVSRQIRNVVKSKIELEREGLSSSLIYISSIIHNLNIDKLDKLIEYAKSLGVDGIVFQMLIPTLYSSGTLKEARDFKQLFFSDLSKALINLDKLIEDFGEDRFVLNTKRNIRHMQDYVFNSGSLLKPICQSYRENLIVTHSGELKYCFNMENVISYSIGSVKNSSLLELVHNEKSEHARNTLKGCRLSCSILNCNN
jgi:MoaA/NifB/PqqE/SkfB family radical SAM enzyme